MTNISEVQQFPLWDKLKNKRLPLSFELEITARCNMSCRHCYINLQANDAEALADELPAAEILDIASQAADLGAVWCLITGGEPLLRKDFTEIYLGLKRLGLLVSVFTNGALINKNHVKLFKKYPPRDIELTVYGVTPEIYESVTRKAGSFKAFSNALQLLRNADVPFRLKAMAIQSNLHEQQEIAKFCCAWTKDFFRFDPQLHLRFDGDPTRNAEIRAERLAPAQIVALEEADERRITAMRKNCDSLIDQKPTRSSSNLLLQCGAGLGSFNVGYDGCFRLCSSLWADGTTYDLKAGSLHEAWHDFVPQVRNLRTKSQEFNQKCGKCDLYNLCLWCPANEHLETGELSGVSTYFCEVANERAKSIKKAANAEELREE